MAKWIKPEDAGCLQTGDIIEVPSKIPHLGIEFPMVTHYGMVSHICGVPYVTHNTVGVKPAFESLSDFSKRRKILRVLRNGDTKKVTDKQIVDRYYKFKDKVYNFFTHNCEDYMLNLCPTDIGYDQRKAYLLGALIVILLLILLFKVFKKK